jgi:hypothetical protein
MSDSVREIETMLATRKLGQLIQKLLPDYTDPIDFHKLRNNNGDLYRTPEETDKTAFDTMREWMGVPHALNAIASALETVTTTWTSLLHGLFIPSSKPIPPHIQREIAKASTAKSLSQELCLKS